MMAIRYLLDEHTKIKTMLAVLEQLTLDLVSGKHTSYSRIGQVLEFFVVFCDRRHFGKEERYLLPSLSALGMPMEGGTISTVLMEHEEARLLIRAMSGTLERMLEGDTGAVQQFVSNSLSFIHLMCSHIDRENRLIYTFSEQILTTLDRDQLQEISLLMDEETRSLDNANDFTSLVEELREDYLGDMSECGTLCFYESEIL